MRISDWSSDVCSSDLSGRVVPREGGDTEFADMRAAWDALPEKTKARIEDLIAVHSIYHSRATIGFTDFTPEERAGLPPVQQRLVRTHPGSGRKIGRAACRERVCQYV